MKLLDEKQVAAILGCTPAALRRWRREGRGPRFVRVEKLIRYRESDLEDFVKQNSSQQQLVSVKEKFNEI